RATRACQPRCRVVVGGVSASHMRVLGDGAPIGALAPSARCRASPAKQYRIDRDPSRDPASGAAVPAHIPNRMLRGLLAPSLSPACLPLVSRSIRHCLTLRSHPALRAHLATHALESHPIAVAVISEILI